MVSDQAFPPARATANINPNPLKAALIGHLVDEQREANGSGQVANRNPLDESEPFQKLCEACRLGDVKTVQSLIAFGRVNINAVDRFDYPPLTLASLCGHYDVVQLLLESGAVCERDTFQGERCLYNALNNRIRNLLLQYDYSKASDPTQPWAKAVTDLLTRSPLDSTDVTVMAPIGESALLKEFRLHKFILSARSPYFRRKLAVSRESSEGKKPKLVKNIRLGNSSDAKAFETLVKFLYLGEIAETFSSETARNIERISRNLECEELWEQVIAVYDPRMRRQKRKEAVEKAQNEMDEWFREFVLGRKMIRKSIEEGKAVRLGQNNESFADAILMACEYNESVWSSASKEAKEGKAMLYPIHKGILKSEFFTTMFTSPFLEGQRPLSDDEPLPIIPIDASPAVLEIVLQFFYSEKVEVPLALALDTLFTADELFIERLKTKAAQVISTAGHTDDLPYSIFDIIRAGWLCRVQRLEEFGAKYIAERLEYYIDDPDLAEIIGESAQRIKERQETDSIELLDDIRWYLNERFRMRLDDVDAAAVLEETQESGEEDANQVRAGEEDRDEGGLDILDEQYGKLIAQIDEMLDRLKLDA